MELFFSWIACVVISVLLFAVVLKIAKHTVGKDANIWQIMTCLILAGPFGWITIVIIFAYEMVDRAFNFQEKLQKR
jgi:uncharacterized protein YaaW (UPF0174 family)